MAKGKRQTIKWPNENDGQQKSKTKSTDNNMIKRKKTDNNMVKRKKTDNKMAKRKKTDNKMENENNRQ